MSGDLWLHILVGSLLAQAILLLKRPNNWHLLSWSIGLVQLIILCFVSVLFLPHLVSAVGVIRESTQVVAAETGETHFFSQPGTIGTLLPYSGEGGRISQRGLHGPIGNWRGVDVVAPGGCGDKLVAPFDAVVIGRSKNDGAGNTSLRLRSTELPLLHVGLVHGKYTVAVGEKVVAGQQIGTEASIGVSSGCHTHLVAWWNGVVFNPLKWNGRKPLIMSRYDPDLGGVNCQEPCSVTSTGALVRDWYDIGAACPAEWTDGGVAFRLPDDSVWRCIDKGGAIVETAEGYWVDLLTKNSKYAFGELVFDYDLLDVGNWR